MADARRVEFVLPVGIGDISWVYSKIMHLPKFGLQPTIYTPGEAPQRAHEFVRLLPNVEWGGYVETSSGHVMTSHVPAQWPATWGWRPLTDYGRVNVTANCHLELGRRLEDWWPILPTEYHYTIKSEPAIINKQYIGIHLSEREECGNVFWRIWSDMQWVEFIARLDRALDRPNFLFIGAHYDAMRIDSVARHLPNLRRAWWIGRDLAETVDMLQKLRYFIGYHDGLSVLANVVRTPALSLMQHHLPGLCQSYADPEDIASGAWCALHVPSVDEAFDWFMQHGMRHMR